MLNVIAMLVSFIALVALANGAFGWVHGYLAWFPANIQTVLGWIFSPIAWVMGVPWHDSGTIGGLLGTRMVLNEFIAYAQLGPMKATLDPVSFTIATFALCGFANISSVGIQIGGIGALVPDRKHDLARLGFRAMLAGTLANFLSATLAGILLGGAGRGEQAAVPSGRRPPRSAPGSARSSPRVRSGLAPGEAPSPGRAGTRAGEPT